MAAKNSELIITRGLNRKPVASDALEQALGKIDQLAGECFFGYPLIATPEGKYSIDATVVSPTKGILLFDLVEGSDIGDYADRQDDLANKIEARLKLHRDLMKGRNLVVRLSVITFAPTLNHPEQLCVEGYPLANEDTLAKVLKEIEWLDRNNRGQTTVFSPARKI